jgi:hypothetical protein
MQDLRNLQRSNQWFGYSFAVQSSDIDQVCRGEIPNIAIGPSAYLFTQWVWVATVQRFLSYMMWWKSRGAEGPQEPCWLLKILSCSQLLEQKKSSLHNWRARVAAGGFTKTLKRTNLGRT